MKKIITLALVIITVMVLAACDGGNTSNNTNENDTPAPSDTINLSPDDEKNAEPIEPAADNIIAQMAGIWVMDRHNPANAIVMILSADGSWESPGSLPTDNTDGGSFVVENEDTDIYHLRLTIEHTTSPHTEIGYVLEEYIYDVQNDRIGVMLHSGEGVETIWFTRQAASEPFGDIAGR